MSWRTELEFEMNWGNVRYNPILKILLSGMYNQLHKYKGKNKLIYRKGSTGYSGCKLHESPSYLVLPKNVNVLECINLIC